MIAFLAFCGFVAVFATIPPLIIGRCIGLAFRKNPKRRP